MPRTRIKICGVRDAETALIAAECGADAIGLVFAESSARRVEPDAAWEIACAVPPFVAKVALFVDAGAARCEEVLERCPCDFAQLHGDETVDDARACGPRIIKAIRFDAETIERQFGLWNEVGEVEALLIDGGAGGEGRSLDWKALARVQEACLHPIILAGGLTPQNVGEAIRVVRPWAVDVSSGVESSRGVKDPGLIEAFCEAVRAADG